ncbi:SLATT domain-containing protein [Microbacterium sp. MYb66]|uniref:SLATT domain-containing protein n=1 Tax=Microbacterium sp. MYb66 TaxID=1848692 RepID=UPI0011B07508
MAKDSAPSGIDSVPPPSPGLSPSQIVEHYLDGYEQNFKRARRTVKRRASSVTIAASLLTGVVAVLGSISAVLATDWWSGGVAVATTLTSATVAVLLAWNDHFHHRELWIQRSAVLAQINDLRRGFAARKTRPWYRRATERAEANAALETLGDILREDLETWTRIQGR